MRLFHSPGLYHVAVRERPGRGPRARMSLSAYTQYFPVGAVVCMHHFIAASGAEAKRAAIAEHRARCMGGKA